MRANSKNTFFGHPTGLVVLFFTEMWERFSYYGMRALLVYYMIKHLRIPQDEASLIYALYTGFVYFTPLIGGFLADRVIGRRRAVIVGGILMSIGHFMMASEALFFHALIFLVLGNGCFKPNISTQVGNLYAPGDPRRDRAFSIFYVGINLGAFFSPLVCGTLGEVYGWHFGFSAAGVGMLVGLAIYLLGAGRLPEDNLKLIKEAPAHEGLSSHEKNRVLGLIVICLVSIAFWAAYEQQGNTMALWADEDTDRRILGWEFPASWFQSLNPLLIFLLTPFLTSFWSWQSKRNSEPDPHVKMAIGCFLLGLGFLVMIIPAYLKGAGAAKVGVIWLVLFSFLVTAGELYLSPVGLSFVTKLSPARMASMMMGVWFLSSFVGNFSAGYLGRYWEKMPKEAFFLMIAGLGFAAGIALLLSWIPLARGLGNQTSRKL
jgi:proton-dependent oligopeptide transporter, POT family